MGVLPFAWPYNIRQWRVSPLPDNVLAHGYSQYMGRYVEWTNAECLVELVEANHFVWTVLYAVCCNHRIDEALLDVRLLLGVGAYTKANADLVRQRLVSLDIQQ